MTLLAKDGRWLKVRVQGRTGYVPRSKVDMADDDDIARNTRRRPFVDGRSKRRGFGSEEGPDDRVGADAVGDGQDDSGEAKKTRRRRRSEEACREVGEGRGRGRRGRRRARAEEAREGGREDLRRAATTRTRTTKGIPPHEEGRRRRRQRRQQGDDEEEGDSRPTVRVAKKVAVLDKPKSSSDVAFTARPDDKLFAIEEKGDWTFVENEDGDGGWIRDL